METWSMDFTSTSLLPFNATENVLEQHSKTNETASEPSTTIYRNLKAIIIYLFVFIPPVIIIAGTIGNVLSVIVFLRTKLKKLSSSYYLTFLAIFDTGFLWCYFLEWLNIYDIDLYKQNGFCQLYSWVYNTCSVISVWLIVAFTVERFMAVIYPLKRQSIYTVRRAKCIVFYLVLFHAINCSPLFFLVVCKKDETKFGKLQCTFDNDYEVSIE